MKIRRSLLHKAVPRLLGVDRATWLRLVREDLLTRRFEDRAAFVRFVATRLGATNEAADERVLAMLDEELASVAPYEGVFSLLAFLRRRGYALGLLSNLSSVHKEPLGRLAMEPMFDAVGFSCDAGMGKPDPRFYLDLAARLGVSPEETLVVGDSLLNDVTAPRALGMRAIRVRGPAGEGLATAAGLGFLSLHPGSELVPLVADGDRVSLGGRTGILRGLRPLPDAEQGRYNLVAVATLDLDGGETTTVYCKRYLFPEAAHVEEFAHQLLGALGFPSCDVVVTSGPEPCLVASMAPGAKLEEATTSALAVQVGRQAALAYLFANADLRPRNAFVSGAADDPILTMIDLEHCFFDLALDVTGIADPFRPESFDRLRGEELTQRVARRVLTPRTMKRARRAFFGTDDLTAPLAGAFRDGWVTAYREVQAQAGKACALLEERILREPFLIIGLKAHRRAMARVDLDEIRRRLAEDAGAIHDASFGVP